ncbi:MAG: tryptophan synthase subunit alpha [Ignavibacteriota bacterium]
MKQSKLEKFIGNVTNDDNKILSVFLTCGFPSTEGFEELALSVFDAGADIIELGVPFSDPIADGSVIQFSSQKALSNKINLEQTLEIARKIKEKSAKPIILMGYANPFLSYGISNLSTSIKQIGIDGIIVPDVPLEESDDFFGNDFADIDTIMLVSPTTPEARVIEIGNKSSGFVYCVSTMGITGKQNIVDKNSVEYVKSIKNLLQTKNVLVGFGISDEESAKTFSAASDGIIIGSAVIKSLMNSNDTYKETLDFIKRVKSKISK